MDYQLHYNRLIETRKKRIIDNSLYYEKHHIIPKSIGGKNDIDNIIYLTPREHFIAHWLLWRIYRNREMSFAFFSMCQYRKGNRKLFKISSKAYEEARNARKEMGISDETRKKMSIAKKGKLKSKEVRKRMSIGKKGSIPWNKGKKGVSDETRKKMSHSARHKKRKHEFFFNFVYQNFLEKLTKKQINVLELYILGFTNLEISEKLSIKDYEIKNNLRSIKTIILKINPTPYHIK